MSRAVILQACAAAAIESFCDEQEEGLRKSVEGEKLFLRPRYSPGYGDFPIQWQHTLFSLYVSYPISWALTLCAHLACYFAVRRRVFLRGTADAA